MPTYKLTIEYDGTRYSGWQSQGNTPRTVQGHLIRAAQQFLGEVEVGGSGRTEAGVHAAGQVAHLRTRKAIGTTELQRTLNDLLPYDIHVLRCQRAADDFHARHDADWRVYAYQISRRRTAFGKAFVWWIKDPLEVAAMKRAAAELVGKHDFSAFSDKRLTSESTVVVVDNIEIAEDGELILIRIVASHFLWKMVRKLVAALVEVGRGNLTVEAFGALMTPGVARFQPTAPPSGLFLEAVIYPGEVFGRPLVSIVPVTTVVPRVESGVQKWVRKKRR